MSETQVILLEKEFEKPKSLNVAQLKTVKWVSSNYFLQQGFKMTSQQYRRLPGVTLLAYLFMPIEMLFVSLLLIFNQLPWPHFMLNIIYKIDSIIEEILETIARRIEWWFDILAVRLMRLRDSIETMIDIALSLVLFISYKVFDFWRWTMQVFFGFFLWLFFPLIWIANKILPNEKISVHLTLQPSQDEISQSKSPVASANDHNYFNEENKSVTSDGESDVSNISESWSIGHGSRKNSNRVDLKATLEGRLRDAMYKRVKTQLTVMRQNSINVSRGVTIYARSIFEPTLPLLSSFVQNILKKLNLTKYYDIIVKWLDNVASRPSFTSLVKRWKSLLEVMMLGKRKSKRTRSMRTESLRIVNILKVSEMAAPGIGLSKSAEPVLEDNPVTVACPLLNLDNREEKKSESEITTDSALPSSIDGSSLNSDDNSGITNDQTIEEDRKIRAQDSEDEFVKKALAEFRAKKKERQNGFNKMKPDSNNVLIGQSEPSANLKGNIAKEGKSKKGRGHSTKKIAFSV